MKKPSNTEIQNARYKSLRPTRDQRTAAFDMVGGGDYEKIGLIEKLILDKYAEVPPSGTLVDVGCGPGRLARYLTDRQDIRYIGTDVVEDLLTVARVECNRPDWEFKTVTGFEIPVDTKFADVVSIFSVFTNIYPEQSFLLMREASRILKPGGTLVVSYMDIEYVQHQRTFLNLVENQNVRIDPLVFLDRSFMNFFAAELGFNNTSFISPDVSQVENNQRIATKDGRVLSEGLSLNQSLCITKKKIGN